MWAFDLIELDGEDMWRDPLAVRKATLASLLRGAAPGLRFNEHLDEEERPMRHASHAGGLRIRVIDFVEVGGSRRIHPGRDVL